VARRTRNAAAGVVQDDPRDVLVLDWKDDLIELARRIWEWWRDRVTLFKFWSLALRLVVLVQPSSAVMERYFSQLKRTLETIGYSALEKTVTARMLARENHGLFD
jgi:hypothetical protein